VSIFRRQKKDDVVAEDAAVADAPEPSEDDVQHDTDSGDPTARPAGPLDSEDVDGPGDRLDLGGLWIPLAQGMEVRAEMDQSTGEVASVHLVLGASALQLQAFAAPRSSGIWSEIRREIGDSIRERGGSTEVVEGVLGTELRAQMPQAGPNGRTVLAPVRFLGVDGPRWFVRAVISGQAAADEAAAADLIDVLQRTVVCRGQAPMAPRELLPMHLPGRGRRAADGTPAAATAEDDGFSPLERGPEITEVR
jgi:hypothetical protein